MCVESFAMRTVELLDNGGRAERRGIGWRRAQATARGIRGRTQDTEPPLTVLHLRGAILHHLLESLRHTAPTFQRVRSTPPSLYLLRVNPERFPSKPVAIRDLVNVQEVRGKRKSKQGDRQRAAPGWERTRWWSRSSAKTDSAFRFRLVWRARCWRRTAD